MSRRDQIAGAVIALVAEEGVRALTHRAVDRRLGLPQGSTSFSFRTRRALIEAAVAELAARSRADATAALPGVVVGGAVGAGGSAVGRPGADDRPADHGVRGGDRGAVAAPGVPALGLGDLPGLPEIAATIGRALDQVLVLRRTETLARYALALELVADEPLRRAVATSAFSRPLAVDLLATLGAADPETAGSDLVSLCEGLVLDRVIGQRSLTCPPPGSTASVDELAAAVLAYLRGATGT